MLITWCGCSVSRGLVLLPRLPNQSLFVLLCLVSHFLSRSSFSFTFFCIVPVIFLQDTLVVSTALNRKESVLKKWAQNCRITLCSMSVFFQCSLFSVEYVQLSSLNNSLSEMLTNC